MATLTGHAYVAALRSLGLQFTLYPGWETRGTWSRPFTPVAPVLHWDASNPGVDLRGYIAGRNLAGWYASRGAGSELVCLSTTRTGHIGQGDMAVVRSLQQRRPVPWVTNPTRGDGYPYQWYWGLEMANRGVPAEAWHPNLVRNGARWAAAHCLLLGVAPDLTIAHLVSTRRKIDIGVDDVDTTGGRFNWRTEIGRHWKTMNGTFVPALPNPPGEIDDMPTARDVAVEVVTLLKSADAAKAAQAGGGFELSQFTSDKPSSLSLTGVKNALITEIRRVDDATAAAVAPRFDELAARLDNLEQSVAATVVAQVGPVVAGALQVALQDATIPADVDTQAVADRVAATLAARLADPADDDPSPAA